MHEARLVPWPRHQRQPQILPERPIPNKIIPVRGGHHVGWHELKRTVKLLRWKTASAREDDWLPRPGQWKSELCQFDRKHGFEAIGKGRSITRRRQAHRLEFLGPLRTVELVGHSLTQPWALRPLLNSAPLESAPSGTGLVSDRSKRPSRSRRCGQRPCFRPRPSPAIVVIRSVLLFLTQP